MMSTVLPYKHKVTGKSISVMHPDNEFFHNGTPIVLYSKNYGDEADYDKWFTMDKDEFLKNYEKNIISPRYK